jgi:hypothetical protein
VEFVGRLAGQDIARIGMISEKGAFIHAPVQDGAAGASEVQKVELSTSGAGSFTIGVKVGSTTYTSTGIEYGANAATVRYALNAALGSVGSVQVSSSVKGTYLITFEGALKGKNLDPVVVTLADAQAGPAGSFKLTLGSESTRSISYTADGAALAKRVQTELARLSNVGAGNVKVSFNPEQSNAGTLGLDIEFVGALAQSNVATLTSDAGSLSNAALAVRAVQQGVQGVQQQQWVVLGTQAQANGYRLSLTHEGQTYTTALIAGNATQAQIQAAVDAGFAVAGARWTVVLGQVGTPQEDTFTLSAGGSLAGINLNLVSLQPENVGDAQLCGR